MLKRYALPPMQNLWGRPERQFEDWLDVEIAAMRARAALGELPEEAYASIVAFRTHVQIDVARINELDRIYEHDMIAFIEHMRELLVAAGAHEAARQFHKPLTSYDIEDPAIILRLREATIAIIDAFRALEMELQKKAREHQWTLMIARTHGQYAEPTTFGCLLMVFCRETERVIGRFERAMEFELSEGKMSGPVGVYGDIDPNLERVALAGIDLKPALAETQILQRDRHASLLATFAVAGGCIEHMCRVFWEYMRSDVYELGEAHREKQRGSSAMPWKENPILTERLMGLARLLRAYAGAAFENIATPDSRDISQSSVERHIFPDATAILYYMTVKAAELVRELVVRKNEMLNTLMVRSHGVWAGQRIRDALIDAGIEPNTAYLYIKACAQRAVHHKEPFRDLVQLVMISDADNPRKDDRTALDVLGQERLAQFFDPMTYAKNGVEHIFRNG